ncbi:MAG TPA: DUF4124 domain-containing protein [Burkholderiales bacterium]|nr:DUF4124 domain-containing protein [Burkholderiales bacterium]
MKPIVFTAVLIAAALSIPAQAEPEKSRMYKCVDNQGKVYYSDKMNPDCGQGSELNRQGVVMPKKQVAKPGQSSKADPGEAPQGSKEQERRDKALMATYTTEEELDAARDRSLAIPAQGIKTVETKLDKANNQLTDLKKQADTLAALKKPLPAHLLEDVGANQKIVSALEADLAQRKAQSDLIRARFESDKRRFRELKSGSQAGK